MDCVASTAQVFHHDKVLFAAQHPGPRSALPRIAGRIELEQGTAIAVIYRSEN